MERRSEPSQTEMALLSGRVEAALDAERFLAQRLRGLSTGKRLALGGLVAIALIAGVAVFARRADFNSYPTLRIALATGCFSLLIASLMVRVLRPLQLAEVPRSRDVALGFAALLGPLAWAFAQPAPSAVGASGVAGGNDCLIVGLILGGLTGLMLSALDRVDDVDLRTKALGALASSAVSNLALVFHCPRIEPLHLALVHAPIGGLLVLFALRKRVSAAPTR